MKKLFRKRSNKAFTLAELLVSLAILGVIATFTIPKVMTAQQSSRFNAVFEEDASTISAAYAMYKGKNAATAATGNMDLSPYLNYVQVYSTGQQIDQDNWNTGAVTCDGTSFVCLKMHNGSVITFSNGDTFGGTATTNALAFTIDPDGTVTQPGSPANGPGKSTDTYLYFNGRLVTYGTCLPGTASAWNAPGGCPAPSADPGYVTWSH